jgi:hypothetical protein
MPIITERDIKIVKAIITLFAILIFLNISLHL